MRITSDLFFKGLRVNSRYFFKQFKSIGVHSRFFFSKEDLEIIKTKLPVTRYKSAKVVKRAFDLLKDSK